MRKAAAATTTAFIFSRSRFRSPYKKNGSVVSEYIAIASCIHLCAEDRERERERPGDIIKGCKSGRVSQGVEIRGKR